MLRSTTPSALPVSLEHRLKWEACHAVWRLLKSSMTRIWLLISLVCANRWSSGPRLPACTRKEDWLRKLSQSTSRSVCSRPLTPSWIRSHPLLFWFLLPKQRRLKKITEKLRRPTRKQMTMKTLSDSTSIILIIQKEQSKSSGQSRNSLSVLTWLQIIASSRAPKEKQSSS